MSDTKPPRERFLAEIDGERVNIWNRVSVVQHDVYSDSVMETEAIVAGDGTAGEAPEYITSNVAEQLDELDVDHDLEVVDLLEDDVEWW